MAEFDSEVLWQELQMEENLLRSKMKPPKDIKKDTKFWRQTIPIKRKTQSIKTYSINITNKSYNKPQTHITNSQTMFKSIKHSINLLNDSESDKSMKMNCLHFINEYLNNYENEDKCNDTDAIEILKNVIKIFVSPKEPLRSLSIDIISNHIGNNNIWNYSTSIKYVIPIVVHCILSKEYYEKSEEVRLKFLTLLQNVINTASNEEKIKPICGDLIAICINLLHDKYIEINKKVCFLIIILSKKIRLNNVSQIIIKNALHLLSDRHSNVRISSIQLIECMLLNGGHQCIQTLTGFREYNNVPLAWWFEGEMRTNYFGALCRHPTLSVRNAFYKMIFNIMTNMRERYDYKTLLLSYVLSGLQDKNKGIKKMTFEAMEKIGKMHENDEYNELKKTLFFQQEAEQTTKEYLSEDDKFELPFPFKHRPCLGSRVLIREHFNRIVHTALDELKNWKNECKEMGILLVRNMIIYAEQYCTQNTELMLCSFHNFITDKNIILSSVSKECCCLIGKYVYSNVWIDCLQDMIYHEFDIQWIIVLQQLMLYCPLKRVYQIRSQVIELMEYVFPFVQTTNYINIHQMVKDILIKTANADKIDGIESLTNQNEINDFVFSSEYCGFHLEIIDETQDGNDKSNDKNAQTLQQRIDTIINKMSSN